MLIRRCRLRSLLPHTCQPTPRDPSQRAAAPPNEDVHFLPLCDPWSPGELLPPVPSDEENPHCERCGEVIRGVRWLHRNGNVFHCGCALDVLEGARRSLEDAANRRHERRQRRSSHRAWWEGTRLRKAKPDSGMIPTTGPLQVTTPAMRRLSWTGNRTPSHGKLEAVGAQTMGGRMAEAPSQSAREVANSAVGFTIARGPWLHRCRTWGLSCLATLSSGATCIKETCRRGWQRVHWMARVACRCVGDVLLRVAVPLHAFWRRVAPEPSSSPQRRTGRSRGPPRGAGLCHVALPLCLHPAERHRKRCNACRRLLQKGHRGAHMARHAAARRGVRLAPWQTVRRARRVWNAAQPNTLSGLVARVACRVASWWGRFWSDRSQAPSLQEGPRRTGAALVRAKVHPYLHAGWRCASSDIALPRIAHCVAFALLLKWCGSFVPAPWAILGAYAAVRAITTMTPRCHGPLCRFATTCSAAAVVAVGYGPLCAAVAAICLCTCPCSALWFAPKKLPGHRVSATTSRPGVRRKPAAAAAEADRPAPPVAAAAEAILQEVQAYMQANGGKMPSRYDPEAKKLYFKFRRIRSRPMPTPAAKALLQILTGGPLRKKGSCLGYHRAAP